MIKTTKKFAFLILLSGLTACGETLLNEEKTHDSDEGISQLTSAEKPDFRAIVDVNQKKAAFFDYLRPAVEHENQRIERERQFLLELQAKVESGESIDNESLAYSEKLGNVYKVALNSDSVTLGWFNVMLKRVDVLPEELVLSQAANESGWGTSRFAVEGNNYFGQWCYRKGCGLVPSARTTGATHEVATFESAYLSVQAYFMNVNRNRAYSELRDIRAAQRVAGQIIEGVNLAEGLSRYSERGHAYVDEIQSMITHNKKYWRQG
ncbi:glucosaminidase domain-containing protein [uncultured Photobacterium sp.]|uniref:glucosaminidase domain-containing protein n=1 Tax=uncultured Photobacterium sp. TaxID=173973 RepID=UPI00262C1D87|nr:glucosaminidase domain-containing protein [uncultured Photobacterium sp.]